MRVIAALRSILRRPAPVRRLPVRRRRHGTFDPAPTRWQANDAEVINLDDRRAS